MTDEQIAEWLAEIEQRAQQATKGPWEVDTGIFSPGPVRGINDVFDVGCGCCAAAELRMADATFIAHARTDVPNLMALVRQLVAERKQMAGLLTKASDALWESGAPTNRLLARKIDKALDDYANGATPSAS